jgi:hypothetical protein
MHLALIKSIQNIQVVYGKSGIHSLAQAAKGDWTARQRKLDI